MKNLKITTLALVAILAFSSCSKDDTPPVNEEEVITTVTAVFTPQGGGTPITLQYKDLDGDGPNAPLTIPPSGNFAQNTTYDGAVTILNETESPAGDITSEVEEEGEEHQLFFQAPSAVGTFVYNDADANGKPIGLAFTLTTKTATTGNLLLTLRHLPNKLASGVSSGDITNAGGATDFEVTYPLEVQ